MKKDEMLQQVHNIQQGKMSPSEMYHIIHEIGREDFREARPSGRAFSHP
jgi:hypothetical protein